MSKCEECNGRGFTVSDYIMADCKYCIDGEAKEEALTAAPMGVLTQLDNASVITRDIKASAEALEADNVRLREALDKSWDKINALGGRCGEYDDFGKGINYGVEQALYIIEDLGGMDPLARAALATDGGA